MTGEKKPKMRLGRVVFGFFFAFLAIFGLVGGALIPTEAVYADPESGNSTTESGGTTNTTTATTTTGGDACKDSLGAIGWLVCPTTGAIAGAVDFLYGVIKDLLEINPVEATDGAPIYEVWKYCRGITNIVFIIFLLVVIYSQITGVGISNYGVKKALPKLIVAAVLVNLSFLICQLAVDFSNIVGSGLRGVFDSVANSAVVGDGTMSADMKYLNADLFGAIEAGAAIAVGGTVIAIETGAIWMLIPLVLGALVAVVTGLITIALRQAVVALLIMVAPLAIVAYILPNTENLFTRWRKLLTQMLVFYPMFSLLFGASNLAGFAIIASAKDIFGVLLGIAVQIFPLFFSWKLMQMSGTFLGTVNTKLREWGSKPVGGARAWANSQRMASRQKYLAKARPITPTLRLMQFGTNRRIAKEAEMAENAELIKNRGLAWRARRNYDKNGVPTKQGEEAYENQARSMEYQRVIERDKNNMEKGLGYLAVAGTAKRARLDRLDDRNVKASDYLKVEQARGEKIAYENAVGFHKRMENAVNVHMDQENGYKLEMRDGEEVMVPKQSYRFHKMEGTDTVESAAIRYSKMSEIMEGNAADVQFAAAGAAHAYDTQKKIIETKYQKYFELLPPTKDVENRLSELTKVSNAAEYIDAIIPGLRILSQRGDTDLVKAQMENVLNSAEGVKLGTHASQALASFLMFEVKDSDPWLRRFGKYINLETARAYNKNDRQVLDVTYDEYIKGYHDGEANEIRADNPTGRMYAKKGLRELIEGTGLDNIERTALSNFDESLIKAYTYTGEDGEKHLNLDEYFRKRDEVQKAIGPQFISASLKYVSGSEQLKSAVKFLTGYDYVQQKEEYIDENGQRQKRVVTDENGNPKYVWEAVWDGEGSVFKDDPERAKKYFAEKTMKYIGDQTPTQIYGLRSDYRDPLLEHFADAYEGANTEGWSDEAIEKRREYMEELAEIQTRYGDLPAEEAAERREADRKKLRKEMAGAHFRQLLDSEGKLNQIYYTRKSGAGNSAKDWVRDLLDLDNETKITMKLNRDREREKKALREEEKKVKRERGESDSAINEDSGEIYDEVDRAEYVSYVEDLWRNLRSEDDDVYYKESLEYIEEKLSEHSFIVESYKHFRKNDPYADSHTLKEFLKGLLSDPGNY